MEERNLAPASAASIDMEVSNSSAGMSREECINRIMKSLKGSQCCYSLFSFIMTFFFHITLLSIFISADSDFMGSFSDPTVRFLRKQMEQAGCPVWVRLLLAANCKSQGLAGGYSTRNGVIIRLS